MEGVIDKLNSESSTGVVQDGRITGEYDFYAALKAMEGKTVEWSLKVVDPQS